MSASWGADDFWDVAARYAGEYNGIKLSAAAAYNEVTDGNYNNLEQTFSGIDTQLSGAVNGGAFCADNAPFTSTGCAIIPANSKLNYFQAGLYIEHVATGVWGMVDYGRLGDDFSGPTVNDTTTWYFKGGLRERWHSLGHTVLYGEYLQSDDAKITNSNSTIGAELNDNKLQVWGVGVGAGDRCGCHVALALVSSPELQ